MQKSDFIPTTMAISAINALNGFAKDSIIAFIQLLVADGLVSEEDAMGKLATMDFGTVSTKKRAPVNVPTSPTGYTDEYLNEVTGAVLRNIAGIHHIDTIKQTGRQTKADMIACIKAHFGGETAEPVVEKEKPKKEKKEKKEKKKEEKDSDDEELRAEEAPEVPKKTEKKEKQKKEKEAKEEKPKKEKAKKEKAKKEKKEEEEAVEAELWEAPNGTTYLKDGDNNLYDKDTQEQVGTWDDESGEVIPV
jgi:hypothetical protein